MSLHRRLVFGVLTGLTLLGIYILCVNLDGPLSWATPLSRLHGLILAGNRDSEERPSTVRPHVSNVTLQHGRSPAPAASVTDQNKVQNNLKSRSGAAAEGKTVTLKPQQPTAAAPQVTEPSYIGDVYMSDDFPPQTDCPDAIRVHVANTEFAKRFLPHVPVLQWFYHVTPEQHQRLSRYPGTNGWSGLSYDMLVDLLSVLNSTTNRLMFDDWSQRSNGSRCIRCAVVGNAGILKNSKQGKDIDAHHYVFRTNGAVIKGFEQDVGSRTTHYTFSTNTMMNSMRAYGTVGYMGPPVTKETRYVFLPDHDRDYLMMKAAATHTLVESGRDKGKDPTKLFGEDVSAEKLKIYHPDFIRYARNRFLRSRILKPRSQDIYRPSTGAAMLLAALHTCDQVSAYGFMTPDYKNYSDHYYDRSYHPVHFYANHDFRLEMTLWQQLHRAGLIRLYMHQ